MSFTVVDEWLPASCHSSKESGLPSEAYTEHGQIRRQTLISFMCHKGTKRPIWLVQIFLDRKEINGHISGTDL